MQGVCVCVIRVIEHPLHSVVGALSLSLPHQLSLSHSLSLSPHGQVEG